MNSQSLLLKNDCIRPFFLPVSRRLELLRPPVVSRQRHHGQDALNRSVLSQARYSNLRKAAKDQAPVSGLTHQFYRYPARFSPVFARTAIETFSQPGDTVLDPYMGGGTTIVEAVAAGRIAVGSDLNELAGFITRVKTTPLRTDQRQALRNWADHQLCMIYFTDHADDFDEFVCSRRTKNLELPIARPIKKFTAIALSKLSILPDNETRAFARCALLNAGQWALNGRRAKTPLEAFRIRTREVLHEMLEAEQASSETMASGYRPAIHIANAADLPDLVGQRSVDLVVTSPPYPGIHMLYHRWQVDGRRESPAPYWIADCNDGKGTSYYNFAGRTDPGAKKYFNESLRTLKGIRAVMKDGAVFVQMIAFGNPTSHLRKYLANMENAGFTEVRANEELGLGDHRRIWRPVPGRSWHASIKGQLNSSKEVVLIHRAT